MMLRSAPDSSRSAEKMTHKAPVNSSWLIGTTVSERFWMSCCTDEAGKIVHSGACLTMAMASGSEPTSTAG